MLTIPMGPQVPALNAAESFLGSYYTAQEALVGERAILSGVLGCSEKPGQSPQKPALVPVGLRIPDYHMSRSQMWLFTLVYGGRKALRVLLLQGGLG